MTICHRTPSGQAITLNIPRRAAEAHLRKHPLDTEGPCPTVDVDVSTLESPPGEEIQEPETEPTE